MIICCDRYFNYYNSAHSYKHAEFFHEGSFVKAETIAKLNKDLRKATL